MQIDPSHPDPGIIAEAAALLNQGGLVVVPTETVYGLAADPLVPEALASLYTAKGRPEDKPIAYLAGEAEQVRGTGAAWSTLPQRLADRFWPGPLTLVLPMADGGHEGFRVPDHAVCRALIRAVGHPLAVTSANLSGAPAACTAEQARAALGARAQLILDAGPSPGGVASTVVRVERDRVAILREGAINGRVFAEMGIPVVGP